MASVWPQKRGNCLARKVVKTTRCPTKLSFILKFERVYQASDMPFFYNPLLARFCKPCVQNAPIANRHERRLIYPYLCYLFGVWLIVTLRMLKRQIYYSLFCYCNLFHAVFTHNKRIFGTYGPYAINNKFGFEGNYHIFFQWFFVFVTQYG